MSEATSGDLTDPEYVAARTLCLQLSRGEGIDAALERDDLDAIVAPSYSFASTPAAVAGYPNISIPVGLTPVASRRVSGCTARSCKSPRSWLTLTIWSRKSSRAACRSFSAAFRRSRQTPGFVISPDRKCP